MSESVFFKAVTHTNDGEQQVQYVAWREGKAVVFVLGEASVDIYTASDPNARPDEGAKRPATVLFVLDVPKLKIDKLKNALNEVNNVDFLDETEKPAISRVDLGSYVEYGAWFGETLDM
jgi:hypothetical protein